MSANTLTPQELADKLAVHAPTKEQAEVVAHPLKPLLVVAGAGSGKTATMSQRVVYLVATGQVRPEQVLGLTFTRKATAELAQRVATQLSQLAASGLLEASQDDPEPTIATYNAFAGDLVRQHGLRIGVDPDSTLITEARAWQIASSLVESCTQPLPLEKAGAATTAVLRLDGALSENLLTVDQAARGLEELEELFTALAQTRGLKTLVGKAPANLLTQRQMLTLVSSYREHKRSHGLLDFGDQIALACRIAEEVPEAASALREQYQAVLLDEFQDTSVAQARLLSALFAHQGVTAVGDPNQAIYGWRGASAGALDTFHDRFNPTGVEAVRAGGAPQEHTPVLQLSTAWRNDLRVLEVANTTSAPLRSRHQEEGSAPRHVPVKPLAARPKEAGLGEGQVLGAFLQDPLEEADHIATFMQERWSPQAQMAVLCRTREQFGPVADALRSLGVPYEVVGLGGMLSVPEVADLRSVLTLAADPERGDRLIRLLSGRGIGASDLRALSRLAREQVRPPENRSKQAQDRADTPLLSEAVEALARKDSSQGGIKVEGLTPRGRQLAGEVGKAVRRVREASALPLPDLVVLAERALDLDTEVRARVGDPLGRRALDAFRAVAEQFTVEMEAPTLAGFLDWLDSAEEREAGLALPEVAPEPGAVQILTIHASKGLEWDTVSVCGLDEQVFPSYRGKAGEDGTLSTSGWMTTISELPHPLRADASTLPPFELNGLEIAALPVDEVKDLVKSYQEELGRHLLSEERRLAYVAFTRARHHLLLTGSHYAKSATRPRAMSRFLKELVRRELVSPYRQGWTEHDEQADNPLVAQTRSATWPTGLDPSQAPSAQATARRQAAAAVAQAAQRLAAGQADPSPSPGADPLTARWREEARLLLAERGRLRQSLPEVHLPSHLAATKVDELRQDPQAFALALRRPLPPRPRAASRLGTVFHEAVAQHLDARAGLLTLQEAGAPQALAPTDREKVTQWLKVVDTLPLLEGWELFATETDLETTIAEVTLRCRMDAVFRQPGTSQWLVVDWKTGSQPVPVEQLSVYVHAWARAHGVDTSQVRAAYVYVARTQPGTQVEELSPQALVPLDELARTLSLGV